MRSLVPLLLFVLAGCTPLLAESTNVLGQEQGEEPPQDCPPGSDHPAPGEICREECFVPPPKPPQGCTYEIFLSNVSVIDNQGGSEGTLELSGAFSVNGGASVAWSDPPCQMAKGQSATTDQRIGSIVVPWHQTRSVTVSGTLTEKDNGGANGEDDVGTGATVPSLTLRCPGTAKSTMPSMPIPLVGQNTGNVNGMVTFSIEAILQDADDDGVENQTDFTRTYCEEHNKGQLGEAVVIYEEYDDGPINSLAQAAGIRVKEAYDTDYDGLALIFTEKPANNLFGLDVALKRKADLLLPSTTRSIVEAYRHYTRKGLKIDFWTAAHGMTTLGELGPCAPDAFAAATDPKCDDSHFSAGQEEPGTNIIPESWLLAYLQPSQTGTIEVPLRMVYMGNCYGNDFADTWMTIGAKVTSGTTGANVYPQKANDAAAIWVAGLSYNAAIGSSNVNPVAETFSNDFIFTLGVTKGCADVYSSMDCADDFWTDDPLSTTDKTTFPQLYYDFGLDGGANMRANTARVIVGDGSISRSSTLTWR